MNVEVEDGNLSCLLDRGELLFSRAIHVFLYPKVVFKFVVVYLFGEHFLTDIDVAHSGFLLLELRVCRILHARDLIRVLFRQSFNDCLSAGALRSSKNACLTRGSLRNGPSRACFCLLIFPDKFSHLPLRSKVRWGSINAIEHAHILL